MLVMWITFPRFSQPLARHNHWSLMVSWWRRKLFSRWPWRTMLFAWRSCQISWRVASAGAFHQSQFSIAFETGDAKGSIPVVKRGAQPCVTQEPVSISAQKSLQRFTMRMPQLAFTLNWWHHATVQQSDYLVAAHKVSGMIQKIGQAYLHSQSLHFSLEQRSEYELLKDYGEPCYPLLRGWS